MKKLILLLPIVLMMLLSGCMHFPTAVKADKESELRAKTFKPNPNTATIHVYKEDIFFASALSFPVLIDNQYVGSVVRGTFCSIEVPPGKHIVATSGILESDKVAEDHEIEFDAEVGENYFFLQDVAMGGKNLLQKIDEATGKQVLSKLSMIAIPDNAIQKIAAKTKRNQLISIPENFSTPSKVTPPLPITGNSGNYMSPFRASGEIAAWAVKVQSTTDNGSDLASNVGGVVGQQIGKKALDFVPFGLGGMIGQQAGQSAGRQLTKKTIPAKVPTTEEAKATSDISFNTANELAVYMYARYSGHSEYKRILELTQMLYPELTRVYVSSIEQAAQSGSQSAQAQLTIPTGKSDKTPQDRLKALQKLKDDKLIDDADYREKKRKILDEI